MPGRQSRWQTDHAGCQETLSRVRVDYEAEKRALQAEIDRLTKALTRIYHASRAAVGPDGSEET